jgi:glycogen synthase
MTSPSSPRRILMTTDTVGGVWHYALALSRGLASEDVEVVLATMGPRPSDEQRSALAALPNVILRESEYRLEWMRDPWRDVARAAVWLLDLERRFAPDIVHLNGYAHGSLPWDVPVLVVGHSCVLSWWRAVRNREAPAEWKLYGKIVRAGVEAADALIAPSRAMLESLQRDYGPVANARVIPNGRESGDFVPGGKEPFVLSVGRVWDDAKNIRLLSDIAPMIAWPVHVAGDSVGPDGVSSELPNVKSLGVCSSDTLAGHYGRASIFALPALYEPFGLSVLEAALSGCALVLGDIPSLREIWQDAAVFVPPQDQSCVRDALNHLIQEPAQRREFARRARERAAHYSVSRMVKEYIDTYRSLGARLTPSTHGQAISA